MSKDRNAHFRPPGTRGLPSPQRIAHIANQGGMTARDRFNNVLVEGALVLYHPAQDVIYQIQKVTPILDPRAQGQMVTVTMAATIPLHVAANQPTMELTMVGLPATPEQADALEKARQAAAEGNGQILDDIGLRGAASEDARPCDLDHWALAAEARDKGFLAAQCPGCGAELITADAQSKTPAQAEPAQSVDGPPAPKGPDDGEST